jgi:tripartite ATP-independent transporter DctM subunit
MPPEQIIAAFMFAGMIGFLFLGFPVAFSLTFTGLFFGLIGVGLGYLQANFFDILPLRIWGTMTNFTLLAVPLFVFMGVALEKSGLAEELLETMALVFGKLKGGIAISVVVVGAILAASTGIVGASVITMGLISLPTMLRRRYHKQLICGTICASGTLGQNIPPSVILILLGDIMGVSVGDLYIGAVIPGLVLVALYIAYLIILSRVKPHLAPPIPAAELAAFRGDALKRVVIALVPALVLIVGCWARSSPAWRRPPRRPPSVRPAGSSSPCSRAASRCRCSARSCRRRRGSRAWPSSSWWAPTASAWSSAASTATT